MDGISSSIYHTNTAAGKIYVERQADFPSQFLRPQSYKLNSSLQVVEDDTEHLPEMPVKSQNSIHLAVLPDFNNERAIRFSPNYTIDLTRQKQIRTFGLDNILPGNSVEVAGNQGAADDERVVRFSMDMFGRPIYKFPSWVHVEAYDPWVTVLENIMSFHPDLAMKIQSISMLYNDLTQLIAQANAENREKTPVRFAKYLDRIPAAVLDMYETLMIFERKRGEQVTYVFKAFYKVIQKPRYYFELDDGGKSRWYKALNDIEINDVKFCLTDAYLMYSLLVPPKYGADASVVMNYNSLLNKLESYIYTKQQSLRDKVPATATKQAIQFDTRQFASIQELANGAMEMKWTDNPSEDAFFTNVASTLLEAIQTTRDHTQQIAFAGIARSLWAADSFNKWARDKSHAVLYALRDTIQKILQIDADELIADLPLA